MYIFLYRMGNSTDFKCFVHCDRCDPYKDETIPAAPDELVVELSQRYIKLYEMITGETFEVPPVDVDVKRRIDENVGKALGK